MTEPEGIPDLVCEEGYVPGWLNKEGLPTSCVGDMPMPGPMPIPEALPEPVAEVAPPVPEAETVAEVGVSPTPPAVVDAGVSVTAEASILIVAALIIGIILGSTLRK